MKDKKILLLTFAIFSFLIGMFLRNTKDGGLNILGVDKASADAVYEGCADPGCQGCGSGEGGGSGGCGGGCSGS